MTEPANKKQLQIFRDQMSQVNSIGILEVEYIGNNWDQAIDDALRHLSNTPKVIIAIPKGVKL